MRKITLSISLSLLLCSFYQAYSQGLIVIYEESQNIQRTMPDLSQIPAQMRFEVEQQIRDQFQAMSSQVRTTQLSVNSGISEYKSVETQQSESQTTRQTSSGDMQGNISMNVINTWSSIYKNHNERLMLTHTNLGGNDYFIEEPLTELRWQIGRERKEISGFNCIQATTTNAHGRPVTAWFTPDIPVNEGPSSFWGLPGLILYVDVNNGSQVISAISIEQTNDLPAIQIPDKGERVTRAEYEKLVEDFGQRIMQRHGGNDGRDGRHGGTMIIRP